jgi:O-succinylbenzoic acid--CoA ligase
MFSLTFIHIDDAIKTKVQEFVAAYKSGIDVGVQTSGSTGPPKTILHSCQTLKASARRTNAFFGLTKSSYALLPLSVDTIAGKMMIIRAIEGDYSLTIIGATSDFISVADLQFDFVPLVPLQLAQIIKKNPSFLSKIKTVLLGGGILSDELRKLIESSDTPIIYQGFGMSETASHIALRQISPIEEASYTAMEGVDFYLSTKGTIIINDLVLVIKDLRTQDLVQLIDEKHFNWIGRIDFTINSGGIKMQIEELEAKWKDLLKTPFFIWKEADELLGERIILVLEGKAMNLDKVHNFKENFSPYEWPKKIYAMEEFVRSESHKVLRQASYKKQLLAIG